MDYLERERPKESEDPRTTLSRLVDSIARSRIVSEAFRLVDRAKFIPKEYDLSLACKDETIDLEEEGSSISQPTLTALMIDYLGLTGREKVLEIGTGSGYSAAVLSLCAAEVHTVEYNNKLSQIARNRLKDLGYGNAQVYCGHGILGLPEHAPYDGIIVTAGANAVPVTFIEQLALQGRLVIPVGRDPKHQRLIIGINYPDRFLARVESDVAFHPLMSKEQGGWTEEKIRQAQAFKKMIYLESASKHGLSEEDVIREQAERMNIPPESFNLDAWVESLRFPEEAWGRFKGTST